MKLIKKPEEYTDLDKVKKSIKRTENLSSVAWNTFGVFGSMGVITAPIAIASFGLSLLEKNNLIELPANMTNPVDSTLALTNIGLLVGAGAMNLGIKLDERLDALQTRKQELFQQMVNEANEFDEINLENLNNDSMER